jgi:micrococcal nuclease
MSLYTYKFVVTRVVDGDTVDGRIDLGFRLGMDTRVRLAGYDAPETWRPVSVEEGKAGELVKHYLTTLLDGVDLVLKSHELDLYNRSIGEIFIGETSVNAEVKLFIAENQLEKARFRP